MKQTKQVNLRIEAPSGMATRCCYAVIRFEQTTGAPAIEITAVNPAVAGHSVRCNAKQAGLRKTARPF